MLSNRVDEYSLLFAAPSFFDLNLLRNLPPLLGASL